MDGPKHAVAVDIWSFEMTSPAQLSPAAKTELTIQLLRAKNPTFLQFLWLSVGGPWSWGDRLTWTPEQWSDLASDPNTFIWAAYDDGDPAGFFELHKVDRDIEITFFGLMSPFIGKGHGGHLLTQAVEAAWGLEASRVWLHTCSIDSPHAPQNYKARGFQQFAEKQEVWQVAEPYSPTISASTV